MTAIAKEESVSHPTSVSIAENEEDGVSYSVYNVFLSRYLEKA